MKFILPQHYIDEGLIRVNQHPTLPLRLYNYSELCQFSKAWDEITLQCRGLIVDAEDNIIARPFRKFFNYEEHTGALPEGTPQIIEKMDGSLGIVFWYDDKWHVATRGSFTSEQALHASDLLSSKYVAACTLLPTTQTHCFEILYRSNRIVVDYGDTDDLVFLGSIETESGAENVDWLALTTGCPFPQPKQVLWLGTTDLLRYKEYPSDNAEGFVLRWPNGFRLKIKFEEYKRLHKILTNTTERTLWEAMARGDDMRKIVESVPDEFYEWVSQTTTAIGMKFVKIRDDAAEAFKIAKAIAGDDRKFFAQIAQQQPHPAILFKMLDGKDPSDIIWKLIKPPATKPFKVDV